MITDDELRELELLVRSDAVEKSRDSLFDFTKLTFNKFIETDFHRTYYQILDLWAKGIITKLIVTMPPQTGKSEGSTRRLPAYCLGINPDERIALLKAKL